MSQDGESKSQRPATEGPSVPDKNIAETQMSVDATAPLRDGDKEGAVISRGMPVVGSRFGRYEIEDELGRGAMGAVFLARDTKLHRVVALKVPQFQGDESGEILQRFYREARSMASLHHRNLCPIYDINNEGEVHYFTMQRIEGVSLSQIQNEGALFTAREAVELVRKLALALATAHDAGVVHRDLKPGNVMMDQQGEPVILDFGLARQSTNEDATLTVSGQVLGTPAYMSPEQVRGDNSEIGPATDIYSLGVILYEMLANERPFHGSVGSILASILTEEPPSLAGIDSVDASLEAICRQAMSKAIDDRYASANEFAAALARYLEQSSKPHVDGEQNTHSAVSKSPRRSIATTRALFLAGFALVATAVVLFGWRVLGDAAPELSDPNSPSSTSDVAKLSVPRDDNGSDSVELDQDDGHESKPTEENQSGGGADDEPEPSREKSENTERGHVFNGKGQVVVPINAAFPLDSFCLEVIVKPFEGSDFQDLIYLDGKIMLCIDENEWLGVTSYNRGNAQVFGNEILSYGEVCHVALVSSDGKMKLYVDGVLQDTNDLVMPPTVRREAVMRVGSDFHGLVESVRLSKIPRYDGDFEPPAVLEPDQSVLAFRDFETPPESN